MTSALLFALTGLAQGSLLWGLWHALQHKAWPASEPLLYTGLLYAALAVPLALYFTQNVAGLPRRVRTGAVLLYGALYAALGSYTAWAAGAGPMDTGVRFADLPAAFVLGFVSISLLCGFDFGARRWRYAQLFHYAWRNGILLSTAGAMVGIVWLVLLAGAGLMKLIGIDWVMTLIRQPVFAFPVSGLVAAGAFALGLRRAAMTETIRRYTLSIAAWLLPLVLFFAVLWVLALPLTGLAPLFRTRSAAGTMLGFMVLAVTFANAAYQDGEPAWPYPRWLARALQGAWLALLAVAAIAWWALGLRIEQHGWSEQRLWAALVATLASVYALGYALSWWRRAGWMRFIAPTNIVVALLLCAGLAAFLSPLANVRALAVAGHLRHLQQTRGSEEPDWNYLRWESGRFGREALQALAAGQGVPSGASGWDKQAARLLEQTRRYDNGPVALSAAELRARLAVYPSTHTLPESFVAYALGSQQPWELKRCLRASASCTVWLGDLNGDGSDELLLFNGGWNAAVFTPAGSSWRRAGAASLRGPRDPFDPRQLEQAAAVAPQWRDLQVQDRRLRLWVND